YDLIVVDAFQGGYVPFHLLTKEFYTLVKQRLSPGGAAVFNVHDGTKLYHSTVKTLGEVFSTVELYPSGQGETATIALDGPAPDKALFEARAAQMQLKYDFRYPLPTLVERRLNNPRAETEGGVVITDDFAPVNLYDTIGPGRSRRR